MKSVTALVELFSEPINWFSGQALNIYWSHQVCVGWLVFDHDSNSITWWFTMTSSKNAHCTHQQSSLPNIYGGVLIWYNRSVQSEEGNQKLFLSWLQVIWKSRKSPSRFPVLTYSTTGYSFQSSFSNDILELHLAKQMNNALTNLLKQVQHKMINRLFAVSHIWIAVRITSMIRDFFTFSSPDSRISSTGFVMVFSLVLLVDSHCWNTISPDAEKQYC